MIEHSTASPSVPATDLRPIRRALLSVTDKTGLVDFARVLASFGVDLVSTGGTSRTLREAGLPVRDISDLTGFPEMLDGRVKTLHPKVHGGILHIRDNAEHMASVGEHAIEPIDMVVVNLYAFEKTAQRPGVQVHHHHVDRLDRKSTRLNSSHVSISYAVFCLKKKISAQSTSQHTRHRS